MLQKLMKKDHLFVMAIMFCSFLIAAEYAITRPTSNAIFISTYSARFFPTVWLATVPINLVVIYLYNHFLPKWGCKKTFSVIIVFAICINLFAAKSLSQHRSFPFLYFIWKDINILLLFKQLWSLIHSTIDSKRAKYLYGIIAAIGGLGGVAGGLIPSFLAVQIGSQKLLYLTAPLYALLLFFYLLAAKTSSLPPHEESSSYTSKQAFSLIKNSLPLTFLLLLVIFMQMSVTFCDYQFNVYLEAKIPELDLRTQYTGRLFTLVNAVTTVLQIVGGFIMVQYLGLKKCHLFIPFSLIGTTLLQMINPGFVAASSAFVYIKAVDYSIFTIFREMLYIPMSLDEKFRAKAIIDVFAYRTARAVASLLVILATTFAKPLALNVLNVFSLILFVGWVVLVYKMFKPSIQEAEELN